MILLIYFLWILLLIYCIIHNTAYVHTCNIKNYYSDVSYKILLMYCTVLQYCECTVSYIILLLLCTIHNTSNYIKYNTMKYTIHNTTNVFLFYIVLHATNVMYHIHNVFNTSTVQKNNFYTLLYNTIIVLFPT